MRRLRSGGLDLFESEKERAVWWFLFYHLFSSLGPFSDERDGEATMIGVLPSGRPGISTLVFLFFWDEPAASSSAYQRRLSVLSKSFIILN